MAIGAHSSAVDVASSGVQGYPQPVHTYLIPERGIYILEWVYLEDLSRAGIYEFLFVCLPLKIRGATGSMVTCGRHLTDQYERLGVAHHADRLAHAGLIHVWHG